MEIKNLDRFTSTIADFDAANAEDPHQEKNENGNFIAKELLYAMRMSEMLTKFHPVASEALELAVRCQHIQRWKIPRDSYPMDRKGYLQWRSQLKKYHSDLASKIMKENGYDNELIDRVSFLLNKKKLKSDPETQILEDVVCLVFLKYYFGDFLEKHPEEKLIDIVRKTWKKMSEDGRKSAKKLKLSPKSSNIIQKALQTV